MIVRHAVDEAFRAARSKAVIVRRRPDIGPEEGITPHGTEDDCLWSVAAIYRRLAVRGFQLLYQDITEEASVRHQPAEPLGDV